jgi:hypothetical protein
MAVDVLDDAVEVGDGDLADFELLRDLFDA